MAKNRGGNGAETAEATSPASEAQPSQSESQTAAGPNYVLHFKRNHPQDRASYGIPGVPGIVVIQRGLIAGTTPFTSNTDLAGMPATITLDALLVSPKADNKTAKAEAAAAKLAERARKAQEKAEAQAKKLAERQAKADAALKAAQERAAAAAGAAGAPSGEGSTS